MNLLHSLAMFTMSSSIILLRSEIGIWLSAMGENLELGTGFRVLVVEERRRMEI